MITELLRCFVVLMFHEYANMNDKDCMRLVFICIFSVFTIHSVQWPSQQSGALSLVEIARGTVLWLVKILPFAVSLWFKDGFHERKGYNRAYRASFWPKRFGISYMFWIPDLECSTLHDRWMWRNKDCMRFLNTRKLSANRNQKVWFRDQIDRGRN